MTATAAAVAVDSSAWRAGRAIVASTLAVAALLIAPGASHAQAPVGIVSLGVGHNSLKNRTKPSGELKGTIDSLDALIAAAGRVGRTSEMRRLYRQAANVMQNRPWTPETEYAASLVIRTDQQVVDPDRRWTARLEQIYAPSIALQRALSARVTLRQRAPGSSFNTPPVVVREVGRFDGVPRDLQDAPFVVEADLKGLADGSYLLVIEVLDSARALGTASLTVAVRAGLNAQVARLEAAAATVAEPVRSDLLYPIDRMRLVNNGRIELRTFDPAADFAAADSVLTAVNARRDPWAGRTGSMERHYLLDSAGEIMPYRLYVPTAYNARKPMPLVVALHGLGATEDSFFDSYDRVLPRLAEERGYIIAAPLGYRVDGAYGVTLPGADPSPAGVRARAFSEQDVMEVLARVKAQYTIDDSRIFLMGHSMGAIGTWALAAKYPQHWAGLGVFSGFGNPLTAPRISGLPQFVVHGDADPTVSVSGSRAMVKALKNASANVTYIEVPGGNHTNVVAPNLPAMFDLFGTWAKRAGRER